jgi:hypothetical protein
MRPFPLGEKTNKQRERRRNMDWGEVEALGMPDLPTILPVDPVSYIMFPHNERGVLWL